MHGTSALLREQPSPRRRAPRRVESISIKDAGRRFAAIPHIRPGHADSRPVAPVRLIRAVPRRLPKGVPWRSGLSGIDVALHEHRVAVLGRDGEAVGQELTIAASTDGVATLLRTLAARAATAAQTLIGLEASGHLWENLEAAPSRGPIALSC